MVINWENSNDPKNVQKNHIQLGNKARLISVVSSTAWTHSKHFQYPPCRRVLPLQTGGSQLFWSKSSYTPVLACDLYKGEEEL